MWDFLVSKPKHYTSEDVHGAVIASTLAILERIKMNVEKASLPVNVSKEKELLKSLGLTGSKNMQVIKEAEAKINVHNTIIEENIKITKIMDEMYKAFGTNTFYVPMKAFTDILDKYNLAVGRLEDYKGTIPETNLQEIANASKIVNTLATEEYKTTAKFDARAKANRINLSSIYNHGLELPDFTEERQRVFNALQQQYPTITESLEKWYRIDVIHPHNEKPEYRRFPMIPKKRRRDWDFRTDWNAHYMLIAAPVQEMNTLYEISERIITDDPIVFSTVGNGVIIYSMWGDEGNDEVLRKYQELNKFIAENVNLGAITESKEALS